MLVSLRTATLLTIMVKLTGVQAPVLAAVAAVAIVAAAVEVAAAAVVVEAAVIMAISPLHIT